MLISGSRVTGAVDGALDARLLHFVVTFTVLWFQAEEVGGCAHHQREQESNTQTQDGDNAFLFMDLTRILSRLTMFDGHSFVAALPDESLVTDAALDAGVINATLPVVVTVGGRTARTGQWSCSWGRQDS